jgi:hypothetical protein
VPNLFIETYSGTSLRSCSNTIFARLSAMDASISRFGPLCQSVIFISQYQNIETTLCSRNRGKSSEKKKKKKKKLVFYLPAQNLLMLRGKEKCGFYILVLGDKDYRLTKWAKPTYATWMLMHLWLIIGQRWRWSNFLKMSQNMSL